MVIFFTMIKNPSCIQKCSALFDRDVFTQLEGHLFYAPRATSLAKQHHGEDAKSQGGGGYHTDRSVASTLEAVQRQRLLRDMIQKIAVGELDGTLTELQRAALRGDLLWNERTKKMPFDDIAQEAGIPKIAVRSGKPTDAMWHAGQMGSIYKQLARALLADPSDIARAVQDLKCPGTLLTEEELRSVKEDGGIRKLIEAVLRGERQVPFGISGLQLPVVQAFYVGGRDVLQIAADPGFGEPNTVRSKLSIGVASLSKWLASYDLDTGQIKEAWQEIKRDRKIPASPQEDVINMELVRELQKTGKVDGAVLDPVSIQYFLKGIALHELAGDDPSEVLAARRILARDRVRIQAHLGYHNQETVDELRNEAVRSRLDSWWQKVRRSTRAKVNSGVKSIRIDFGPNSVDREFLKEKGINVSDQRYTNLTLSYTFDSELGGIVRVKEAKEVSSEDWLLSDQEGVLFKSGVTTSLLNSRSPEVRRSAAALCRMRGHGPIPLADLPVRAHSQVIVTSRGERVVSLPLIYKSHLGAGNSVRIVLPSGLGDGEQLTLFYPSLRNGKRIIVKQHVGDKKSPRPLSRITLVERGKKAQLYSDDFLYRNEDDPSRIKNDRTAINCTRFIKGDRKLAPLLTFVTPKRSKGETVFYIGKRRIVVPDCFCGKEIFPVLLRDKDKKPIIAIMASENGIDFKKAAVVSLES